MWSGVSDEVLVPDAALPSQFDDIWHRSRAISPERALALAVIWEAVIDLGKYRFATRRRQQRLYWEAYAWVTSNERGWPYSFVNLCDTMSLAVEPVRKRLLGEMAPLAVAEFSQPVTAERQAA
ncbi:MAG: hypothetical protein ACRERC_01990 [Candidatus Binatia bacterium]